MTTWHLQNVRAWQSLVAPLLPDRPARWLEIGSHEGGSARWVLDELLQDDDQMTCVDPWADAKAEAAFTAHVATDPRVEVVKARSQDWLPRAIVAGRRFDVAYIDGDHDAASVIADAVLAWSLLPRGGLLLFDDYRWMHGADALAKTPPKVGVDSFIQCHQTQLTLLHAAASVVILKRREGPHDMRRTPWPNTRGR